MPDIGWMELLVIGVVALIVVGPEDLPQLFRRAGQAMGKVRGMAREFSRAMNDAAGDTGMTDIARDMRNMTNPKKMGLDAVNKAFEGIDPDKYPEGSETRKLAEKRKADQDAMREKVEQMTVPVPDADAPEGPVEAVAPAAEPPRASTPET